MQLALPIEPGRERYERAFAWCPRTLMGWHSSLVWRQRTYPRCAPGRPRQVRVPLLSIETQRAYGEAFRRLWDFARILRAAHDEGIDFVRDLIDATAASITEATGTERSDLVHGS